MDIPRRKASDDVPRPGAGDEPSTPAAEADDAPIGANPRCPGLDGTVLPSLGEDCERNPRGYVWD
ncbi:hypothetical protein [Actinoalloteichus caeruleus]|uniref:Uncharacterized protein n=1 Tax=Actinoalloteichus caeruleus DSM 43889 TaxID=1120930 RepID=A0ABT1JQ90_ACTCY|nr:hypothetical protein [Actinoalloteichus caeruleus]MCP2334671.1 hypothetical protein [Actinoalloteichus caeruleus DSM 43889]